MNAVQRRTFRPPRPRHRSPSPACRPGSGSPSWRPVPSGSALGLVPVPMPCALAAPRSLQVRFCHPQMRCGATPPSGLRRGSPAGRRYFAAASRPSIGPSCSQLSNSALHPIVGATMASADFSAPVARRRRRPAPVVWRDAEISQGKTLLLPPNAAGFTRAMSDWLLGFPVLCRVTPPHQPAIRFLCVGSGVCLKAASPPTSR